MRKLLFFFLLLACGHLMGQTAGLKLDSLVFLNVDSTSYKLVGLKEKKALILVFTGNHCVYSKKYEDRLIALAKDSQGKGAGFVLVNSNAPDLSQDDRFPLMQARAKEKAYPCPYLHDPEAKLAKLVGATKNPEAFLLVRTGEQWVVVYAGKIDDNPLMDTRVEHQYLREALDAVLGGQTVPASQVAVGCNIKQ